MIPVPLARIAQNADGSAIKALLVAAGPFDETLPFDDIHPYWIVAELGGRIVGCIQTCPSRPVGHLEMLAVASSLTAREHAAVIRVLFAAGITCLHLNRSYMAAGFIPFELKAYKRWLKKRGATVADSGNMMMWRLDMDTATDHPYKEKSANGVAA